MASLGHLGASLEHPGGLLGCRGRFFDVFMFGQLGGNLGASCGPLGGLLGHRGSLLWASSGATSGASMGLLGAICSALFRHRVPRRSAVAGRLAGEGE